MTEEDAILAEIQQLPEHLKEEVRRYVEFLLQQHTAKKMTPHKKRKAGSAAGKFTLAADFDAPLEDFEEYMQ
jgi:hypothetical protein